MKIFLLLSLAFFAFGSCEGPPRDASIPTTAKPSISEVSPSRASEDVKVAYSQFIDVRTPEEFAAGHAERARNIPLDRLTEDHVLLRRDQPVYIICRTDNRSKQAAAMLAERGFKQINVITGGSEAWSKAGLPIEMKSPHNQPSNR